ncbi:MAG: N-acetylmuramoyl-L-alanine amidase [Lachnospiraceae bacterium]|nr:N-acetylmuramoyl-L-alanine amidase [Lachnospiraceae bacterium]
MKQLSGLAKGMFCLVGVLIIITLGLGIASVVKDAKLNKGKGNDTTNTTPSQAPLDTTPVAVPTDTPATPTPTLTPKPTPTPEPIHVVAVDAGKYKGFGASSASGGLAEYQLNLLVAKLVQERLIKEGYEVIMCRETDDETTSQQARMNSAIGLGAEIFVSIQCDNTSSASANGIYAQIPSKSNSVNEDSRALATCLHKKLINATGAYERSISEVSASSSSYDYLNNTTIPSTIVRMGYLTNVEEDAKLQTEEYRQKIADAIVDGILTYFTTFNTGTNN